MTGEDRPAAASAASCTAAPAGNSIGRGWGARNHTGQPKENTCQPSKAQSLIRWQGGAERGNSLPAGNVAVVIL